MAAPAVTTAILAPTAPTAPTPQAPTAGLRVLLVEDGPDNQKLIRRILERSGMRVEVVGDGAASLTRLEGTGAGDFDLVLMDVQMPVMDGMTATARLRERACRLPIVALTASAMVTDQEACLRAGCSAFLTKPIDRPRLLQTIAELTRGAPSGAATQPTTRP